MSLSVVVDRRHRCVRDSVPTWAGSVAADVSMRSAGRKQRAAMFEAVSRQHGAPAKREFIAHRDKLFAELAAERKTKRWSSTRCATGACAGREPRKVGCRQPAVRVAGVEGTATVTRGRFKHTARGKE
jgi:hypothetical protein